MGSRTGKRRRTRKNIGLKNQLKQSTFAAIVNNTEAEIKNVENTTITKPTIYTPKNRLALRTQVLVQQYRLVILNCTNVGVQRLLQWILGHLFYWAAFNITVDNTYPNLLVAFWRLNIIRPIGPAGLLQGCFQIVLKQFHWVRAPCFIAVAHARAVVGLFDKTKNFYWNFILARYFVPNSQVFAV